MQGRHSVYDDCTELTRAQFAAVFGNDSGASGDDFSGVELKQAKR